jgi:hypothetical protein
VPELMQGRVRTSVKRHSEKHNRRAHPARSNIMLRMKSAMAALFAVILSIGLTTIPPVDAQTQTGLVNVAIGDITTGDILSNNTVTVNVAANIATNVCGNQVQVGVLALQLQRQGQFYCENQRTKRFARLTRAGTW